MAKIITFRGADRRQPGHEPPARRTRTCAEVVIFPGVRVERWGNAKSAADPDQKVKPRRDLLEIK